MNSYHSFWKSPLGWLKLESNDKGLRSIHFCDRPEDLGKTIQTDQKPYLAEAKKALKTYFKEKKHLHNWTIDSSLGTPFQRSVWKAVLAIPYGETRSYVEIAQQVGKPKSARAVGAANGKNPIAILIPCHRLVGKDGKLRGYAGGIERKQALIELENKNAIPVS